ncbi:hypothetical protein IDJ77_23850 [Mucilaginibacter sp. ZT4R22]|uniref:Superfamily IV 4 TMS phage holin n=1 Tax=Mucilaginibacter pankratovii TaxID=2772110 RepID=A0ABR7WX35_9SPHI|nr:hypothetical protein [Mucilaginibacter pankratovii]MBD1366865.1 hypothetical protein [Mucilaginibacter pankratovii]
MPQTLSSNYNPFKIAILAGVFGGFSLIAINLTPFTHGYNQGNSLLLVFILTIVGTQLLNKYLAKLNAIFIQRVAFSTTAIAIASIIFLVYEIIFTVFANNKTIIGYIFYWVMMVAAGFVISLLSALFIKPKKV